MNKDSPVGVQVKLQILFGIDANKIVKQGDRVLSFRRIRFRADLLGTIWIYCFWLE